MNRKQINVLPVSVNTRVFLNVRRKPSAVLQSDWKFYKHSFIRFSIILAHSKFLVRRSRRFRLRHVRRTGSDRNYPGWGSQSRGNRQPVWRRGENRYQKIKRRRKKKTINNFPNISSFVPVKKKQKYFTKVKWVCSAFTSVIFRWLKFKWQCPSSSDWLCLCLCSRRDIKYISTNNHM